MVNWENFCDDCYFSTEDTYKHEKTISKINGFLRDICSFTECKNLVRLVQHTLKLRKTTYNTSYDSFTYAYSDKTKQFYSKAS